MRMLLRSRRTIVTSLVLPAILIPAMTLGSRYAQRQQALRIDQTTFRYAVTGPWADDARRLIERYKNSAEFRNFRIEEMNPPDPEAALSDETLHFIVRTITVQDADKAAAVADEETLGSGVQAAPRVTGVPGLQVVYRGSLEIARRGAE